MKKKQEIKVGTILELTPAEEAVVGSMLKEGHVLQRGVRTLIGMHDGVESQMFKVVNDLFPETKDFHLAADLVGKRVSIHVRDHR